MIKNATISKLIQMMWLMKRKRRYLYIISLCICVFAPVCFNTILAYVNKNLLNAVVCKDITLLRKGVVLAILAIIMSCIINPISRNIFYRLVKKNIAEIRLKLLFKMEKLPKIFYNQTHSGDLLSRITNDVNIMENAYGVQMHTFLLSIFTIFGSAISMIVLDWRLAIFTILLSALYPYMIAKFTRPIRHISRELQEHVGILTQLLSDILAGFRMIKIFNLGSVMIERYIVQNDQVAQKTLERVKRNASLNSVNYFLFILSQIGILIFGSIMIIYGISDLGTIIAVFSLQNSMTLMSIQIGNFYVQLQGALAGTERVLELLKEKEEPETYDINDTIPDVTCMISLKDIIFRYDNDKLILSGINIRVNRGQVVALVGESGSGKSTVIKLLMGFYAPESGSIAIDGKAMNKYKLQELRSKISYIPQESYLFDGTIEENIRLGDLSATKEQVIQAAKAANAHDFIIKMKDGYDARVGERGGKLSGGQRQRVSIARAFLKNSPIILLDEATASLDSESEYLVQQGLDNLINDRTTIIVAHRLSTIKKAEMIYVIDNGKVVEQGTHDWLIKQKGFYKLLYDRQFEGMTAI